MQLEILICTYNDRIARAAEVLLPEQEKIKYLISYQLFDYERSPNDELVLDTLSKRSDVRVVTTFSKGLSRNRNSALENATGDVLLISDDDAKYSSPQLDKILRVFDSSPSDIITFKIVTPDEGDYKRYSNTAFQHNKFSVLRVSSLEIAIRRQEIVKRHLIFDEQFGLGAQYPACEEAVFLASALEAGMQVSYEPVAMVVHPRESSGRSWSSDDSVKVRGALFKRIFGYAGLPLLAAFALKQFPGYSHNYSLFRFLRLSITSFVHYTKGKPT